MQCHLKADIIQQRRVQLIRQVMHIVGYVHYLVLNRRKLVARFRQRGREGSAQHFEIKGQCCQPLVHIIMEIPGEPPPFIIL
ncbi:MAG TPA: hypothetical protein VF905_05395, partial [Nitrospirota bacterium]